MQQTIRTLRIVLPILFLAFLAIIVLSWRRAGPRTRDHGTVEPVVGIRKGPKEKPQIESKEFEDTQTVGGRVVSYIHAHRVVNYSSNWNTLETVELKIYRLNGLTYELSCPSAEYNSVTKEANAKGGVQVTSSDGIAIQTAEIHFDGNRLTNKIPVQFTIDRWRGTAGALDLDVTGETLRLFQKLSAALVPEEPAQTPMTIDSEEGYFRRKENDVAFTTDVKMTRAADVVTAGRIIGRFSADRKKLVDLFGDGNVDMIMAANPVAGDDMGGRKEITTKRFTTQVGPDGDLKMFHTWGDEGYSHAVLDGPPSRDILCKDFILTMTNRVVTELRANLEVVMKEFGPETREVRAGHIIVYFDPVKHRPSSAQLVDNVKYTDPRNTATSHLANYDIVNDRVLLTASEGFDPTVVADGQILKAHQIEFSPKGGTAKATGSVIAQLISKPQGGGPSVDTTNLFPAGKPVYVNSDSLLMRQASKTAVFNGNVRAWQDTNTVFAQEVQVTGAGDSVLARGNVRTILYNTGGEPRKVPINSRSDQLLAKKAERRIDLTGNVHVDDEGRSMTSDKATMLMDANRKIERIESEGKVQLVDTPGARKGSGDKAIYLVPKKMIYISGAPATVTAPTGTLSGEQIAIDLARNKVEVMSPTGQTKG
ncbi:MAG: LptA/OstA family protein, partial [Thermoanaerobaculia bacterium]